MRRTEKPAGFVTGHDFSRAGNGNRIDGALAPEVHFFKLVSASSKETQTQEAAKVAGSLNRREGLNTKVSAERVKYGSFV
jgi:hypothetical protein